MGDIVLSQVTEQAPLVATGSKVDEKVGSKVHQSEWWQTMMLLVGEVMGTGVLSLPFACANLGWPMGLASLILFAGAAIYSSLLLSHIKNHFYPEALSYADVARLTNGPAFERFVRWVIVLSWAMLLVYFLIAAGDALALIYPKGNCFRHTSLVVAALLSPLLQIRSMHSISYLCGPSTLAIVLAIALTLHELLSRPVTEQPHAPPPPASDADFTGEMFTVYGSLASFIFAYQGQSIMLEMMREMREPAHFGRAAFSGYIFMMFVYSATVVVSFGSLGGSVPGFLPDALVYGGVRQAVGWLLTYHIVVAFVITAQPLHRSFHGALFPHTLDVDSWVARLHWAVVSLGYLAVCLVLSNKLPFFADMQALIGALGGSATCFGFPAYFYLRACRLNDHPISRADGVLCTFFVAILTPVLTVFGTWASLRDIARSSDALSLASASDGCAPLTW